MALNDGKAAEDAFVEHWRRVGHVQRFRDKKDLSGLNRGIRLADFKKPPDFVVSSPTIPLHYAEVKSTNHKTAFPFGQIEDGQSAAAKLEALRGHGNYIFYIFSYELSKWFTMPAVQYVALLDAGRRSVKFTELTPWNK